MHYNTQSKPVYTYYEMSDLCDRMSSPDDRNKTDYGDGVMRTSSEVHTLSYIASHPNCSVTDIAAYFGKTISTCSLMVKKLRKAGLIDQVADVTDRKRTLIRVTEAGAQLDLMHRIYDENAYKKCIAILLEKHSEDEIMHAFLVMEDMIKIFLREY